MSRLGRSSPRHEQHDPAPGPAPGWRGWMEACGRRVREVRSFLGLSQEQVAKLAGVSQGAVSRLEMARGLATPLLVVLRVDLALRQALRKLPPQVMSADLHRALETGMLLLAPLEARGESGEEPAEAELEELVRLYRELPPLHRSNLLSIVRAVVPGLRRTVRPPD